MLQPLGQSVAIHTQERVLDAILAQELKVMMVCGGKGLCATCHCWIEKGMDQLTPMTEREKRTLGRITGANERSRLSCQARVLGPGVEVRVPEGMYVQGTVDLEALVGQRAKSNILHPIDGRTLVPGGKIITRSRIMELKDLDVEIERIRTDAARL